MFHNKNKHSKQLYAQVYVGKMFDIHLRETIRFIRQFTTNSLFIINVYNMKNNKQPPPFSEYYKSRYPKEWYQQILLNGVLFRNRNFE